MSEIENSAIITIGSAPKKGIAAWLFSLKIKPVEVITGNDGHTASDDEGRVIPVWFW